MPGSAPRPCSPSSPSGWAAPWQSCTAGAAVPGRRSLADPDPGSRREPGAAGSRDRAPESILRRAPLALLLDLRPGLLNARLGLALLRAQRHGAAARDRGEDRGDEARLGAQAAELLLDLGPDLVLDQIGGGLRRGVEVDGRDRRGERDLHADRAGEEAGEEEPFGAADRARDDRRPEFDRQPAGAAAGRAQLVRVAVA